MRKKLSYLLVIPILAACGAVKSTPAVTHDEAVAQARAQHCVPGNVVALLAPPARHAFIACMGVTPSNKKAVEACIGQRVSGDAFTPAGRARFVADASNCALKS